MKTIVILIVNAFLIYLLIGLIVAFIVQQKGLQKIDPSVDGAGVWFRIITFPGVILLWPLILYKWIRVSKIDS